MRPAVLPVLLQRISLDEYQLDDPLTTTTLATPHSPELDRHS